MANYDLTRYSTGEKNSVDAALEALETKLETVADTKTVRGVGLSLTGRDREQCVGWLLFDT